MSIKPGVLPDGIEKAGFVAEPLTALGPRGIDRRGDLIFGPLPLGSEI
ncbi:hypothetical protein [Roseobacter weihaiensis]|nr:hypothetical protein [Roseobacter sp. H9]